MAIAPKIKHVDQRPNGVLRFRRRFPKDVAEHLGKPALQVHIRNTSGLAFHQEYQAILREFDRIVSQTRETLSGKDTRDPIERWHEALLKMEGLVAETSGLEDDPVFARHEIARGLKQFPGTDPYSSKLWQTLMLTHQRYPCRMPQTGMPKTSVLRTIAKRPQTSSGYVAA